MYIKENTKFYFYKLIRIKKRELRKRNTDSSRKSFFYKHFDFYQFCQAETHIGGFKKHFSGSMKSYIIGKKGGFVLMNTNFSYMQWKSILNILVETSFHNGYIWIINELIERGVLNNEEKFSLLSQINVFNQKWVGGLLTNFKLTRLNKKIKHQKLHFPWLLFILTQHYGEWATKEASLLQLPAAVIGGVKHLSVKKISYLIPGSQDFSRTAYYYYLILLGVKKGKQKTRLFLF